MATTTSRAPRPLFTCGACGELTPKWQGRCPHCGEWNSIEETASVIGRQATRPQAAAAPPLQLSVVNAAPEAGRLASGFAEVDRVLGGGFVPGSVVLLGGDPGVGKSTLALQIAGMHATSGTVLYCSGEESAAQLAMRARRLRLPTEHVSLLIETDLETVVATIVQSSAALAIVDSVQTLHDPSVAGSAGSPTQVRAAVGRLVAAAKERGTAVLLVGHVTKEGAIAGPRTLEHMVDVVLYLEGDRLGEQRLLRGVKNRFGSTGELGLLAMEAAGIRETDTAARGLLDGIHGHGPGSVLTVMCDGLRPIALEVQALALKSNLVMPRRTVSGFDANRLHVLLAVLEKRGRVATSQSDVFLNVVGGVHLSDPGADLAVALAVAGSAREQAVPRGCAVLGEVGLGGELRRVARLEARLKEAAAVGTETAIIPAPYSGHVPAGMTCHRVATLAEALRILG